MKCDKCNYENPDGLNICLKCGAEIIYNDNLSHDVEKLLNNKEDGSDLNNYYEDSHNINNNDKDMWLALILSFVPGFCQYYLSDKESGIRIFKYNLLSLLIVLLLWLLFTIITWNSEGSIFLARLFWYVWYLYTICCAIRFATSYFKKDNGSYKD